MSILRKHTKQGYTHIDNQILNAEGLSFRARGIAAFLLSKPNDWTIRIDYLAHVGKEGEQAIRTAMQELATAGFLMRERVRNDKGHLSTITHIADYPAFAESGTAQSRILGYEETDPTENGSTDAGSTVTGGVLVTTDLPITDGTNTEEKAAEPPAFLPDGSADQDGRFTIQLLQDTRLFAHFKHDSRKRASALEEIYSMETIRKAIVALAERHRKMVERNGKGVYDPIEFLAKLLADDFKPKPPPPAYKYFFTDPVTGVRSEVMM